MSVFSIRTGLLVVVAALCLGGRTAHAQAAPLTYWSPGWIGFGGSPAGSSGSNAYGSFAGLDASDIRSAGSSATRFNFPNGLFVGGASGSAPSGMSGFNQAGTFGGPVSYQSAQFGYNFQNAPVTIYSGFNTAKYNSGIASALAPFDATSSTLPVYNVHGGVEFRPTSNLSLSLGVGYTRIDSDGSALSQLGASPFSVNGRR